jgi:hypothetical protein
MADESITNVTSGAPAPGPAVSPNNPCPFLRAAVSEGFIRGDVVPIPKLCETIEAASGKKGLQKKLVGMKTYPVALIANGLNPLRLLKSWWSGAQLDALRNGPLDKHGVGSRILDATAKVHESEIARLAEFGSDWPDPCGGTERGLTSSQIKTYMDANFERAKDNRRWYDRLLMKGEWPVLLDVMGKGEGDKRYLSVAEVRTLFVDRRLPDRINARLAAQRQPSRTAVVFGKFAKAVFVIALLLGAAIVAIAEFPNQLGKLVPPLAKLLPPPLPKLAPAREAHWLEQNWPTDKRHWFHHASQGTATFPVPYSWFLALEQPGLHLFTWPGMLADSAYLERFGFIPSPKSVDLDAASLRRFGYSAPSTAWVPDAAAIPALQPTPAENFDGLPVGFARMKGAINPGTGTAESDKVGLTCAACHTGHINYKGVSVRFDGGPATVNLKKLELATGLSIAYTTLVPFRFNRFATRVLGPNASKEARAELKSGLKEVRDFLLTQVKLYEKTIDAMKTYDGKDKQKDTEEGFGRLDALNRIGNQVFFTDLVMAGLSGYEKNIHANDAPVSFPPIWTVPWFWWAQYDASIEQPLIRNAGEALGVAALVNLSPNPPTEALFRSSVALQNLIYIEENLLRGKDPFRQDTKRFDGLQSPKWPSHLFPNDEAWKIKQDRIVNGRALYAQICVECHLGPVSDPQFDAQFPDKSFWKSKHWKQDKNGGWVLDAVQKPVAHMGTDPAQAEVLEKRSVEIPGFFNLRPTAELDSRGKCDGLPVYSPTKMPFAIGLMIVVDKVSTKWMDDNKLSKEAQAALWGERSNCPNLTPQGPHYRARPLNGIWATAPYLHNGSVPSLHWMLMPAASRPKQFCMGARDFDPEQVGFRVPAAGDSSCKTGETLFSMMDGDGQPIHGNSVLGHSFEAAPDEPMDKYQNGVIGRALSEPERNDLIEYLKTL